MRLLLAEDEKELSNALVAILKHNNYSIDVVDNGLDAVSYLETGVYDAAILDIMMPVMDGITALKQVRAKGITTPIIMLTAKSEIDDKVLGLDSGANDYMTKPFSAKELLARIRVMTRSGSDIVDTALRYGNVTLNRTTYDLSAVGGTFKLANKEYQMMEMLLTNPGQVISIDRFLEKIWGFESEIEQNVVWVYISYLRKKLTNMNANVQIKAIRNVGYALEVLDDKKA